MKTKVLILIPATGLLVLAAWLVHRNYTPDFDSPDGFVRAAQRDEPNRFWADKVPEKYREPVHKGLAYLAKNQCKDGHWEGDGGQHPVAMTGLAGLALLMEVDANSGKRARALNREAKCSGYVRKAVDWLMDKSQANRDGLIFSDHPSETTRYMEGHGLATLFLAGAFEGEYDDVRREKLAGILSRAVKYILKAQSTQGGWYHTSRVEGHDFDTISATAIQIQALQAAENAGIPVPHEAINDALEYLRMALGKYEDEAVKRYRSRHAEIAASLACRTGSNLYKRSQEQNTEPLEEWMKYCQTEIPVGHSIQLGRDELTHYYYAQAVFNLDRKTTWTAYRTAMFDHLQNSQNKVGSWPAGDGIGVGPIFSTAVWCIILQLDKRSHPSLAQVKMMTK